MRHRNLLHKHFGLIGDIVMSYISFFVTANIATIKWVAESQAAEAR